MKSLVFLLDFGWWIGVFIGIVGIAIGAVSLNSIRNKKPLYYIKTQILISEASARQPGLEVLYQQIRVRNLTRLLVVFWNSGREALRRIDLPAGDQLRIELGTDIRILSCRAIAATRPSIAPEAVSNGSAAVVVFDYLDQRDGIVIELLVEGKTEKAVMKRKIIGSQEIRSFDPEPYSLREAPNHFEMTMPRHTQIDSVLTVVFPLLSSLLFVTLLGTSTRNSASWIIFLISVVAAGICVSGAFVFRGLKRALSNPRKMDRVT